MGLNILIKSEVQPSNTHISNFLSKLSLDIWREFFF